MHLNGTWTDFLVVFFSGVIVSFTPCVYPILPVTVSYISGINTEGSKITGLFLSLFYVLGIALTYCSLAVVAALTGQIFGQWQNQPGIYFLVGILLLFFGVVMLDWIRLPFFQITFHHKINKKHVWAVIVFGVVAGLMVGPCTSPVLGSLLVYAGSKKNILHAVILMFVFSYGVGFSLILAGTFSGLLEHLPKAGKWMEWIKRLGAVIIIAAGIFYILKSLRMIG
ncbi:MAG: sulfite exporter TauE/SafE family protein [Candidatus Omnitrophica bacterium]|nr:sulfite exporter TauE/SafE family protein [Candidatus Omnitrophota bacterium]